MQKQKGEEGKFYIFTKEEIIDALGKEYGEFYCNYYDIIDEGNLRARVFLI